MAINFLKNPWVSDYICFELFLYVERVLVSIAEHGMSKKAVTCYVLLYYMQRLRNYPHHYLKPYNNAIVMFGAIKKLSKGADSRWVLLMEKNGERGASVRFGS